MKWLLHGHHTILCELLTAPIEEREQHIRKHKPKHEIATRLRVMRELTEEEVRRLPGGYQLAVVARQQADRQVWVAYEQDVQQARVARQQARVARQQAEVAYQQVRVDFAAELDVWHKEVCVPDCPWDGHTLFPGGE